MSAGSTGPLILIVDDEPAVRALIARSLERHGYASDGASGVSEARDRLAAGSYELVITDMNMPGGSGLDLLADVLQNRRDVAAIMVTGEDSTSLAEEALRLGAYGYLVKPVSANQMAIEVKNALLRRSLEIEARSHQERLKQTVKDRTAELWTAVQNLERTRDELRRSRAQTVERLSIAAEFRDDETARHIHRMSRYCELLARLLGYDAESSELVRIASVMHDVGKIGIPDNILLKPGKLTPAEYEIMKQHATIGHRILADAGSDLLDMAASIALSHHERVDGSGYPHGIKGDEIPLEGRIAAVADVFDALTTDRIYRKAFHLGEAIRLMKEGRGSHFDARLLDAFLGELGEVLTIKEQGVGRNATRADPRSE